LSRRSPGATATAAIRTIHNGSVEFGFRPLPDSFGRARLIAATIATTTTTHDDISAGIARDGAGTIARDGAGRMAKD
jgi:hypothetical protein